MRNSPTTVPRCDCATCTALINHIVHVRNEIAHENPSQFAAKCQNNCRIKLAPLNKSGGSGEFEIVSAVKGTLLAKMVVDEEAPLCKSGLNADIRWETYQTPLADKVAFRFSIGYVHS